MTSVPLRIRMDCLFGLENPEFPRSTYKDVVGLGASGN